MKNITNNKIPQKCQAKNPLTGEKICDRRIWDSLEQKCIFHYPKTKQPKGFANEFKKHFLEELKKVDESDLIEEFNGEGFLFPDKTKLNDIVFTKAVNFNHCDFGNGLSFQEAKFNKDTTFKYSNFGNSISFLRAQFLSDVSFNFAKFGNANRFDGIQFDKGVSFDKARFGDSTRFLLAKFPDNMSFLGVQFGEKTDFDAAEFGNNVNFEEAKFGNKAYFVRAKFGDNIIFSKAQFGKNASFRGAQFGSKVSFSENNFGENLSFLGSNFGDQANFYGAQFGNNTSFSEVQFENDAIFESVKFGDYTNFGNVVFLNHTSFLTSRFGFLTNFEHAKFGYENSFDYVEFGNATYLNNIQIDDRFSLNLTRFKGEAVILIKSPDKITFLTNIKFERPNEVRIQNTNLNKTLLSGSNINEVEFLECKWPKKGNRYFIFDEDFFEKKEKFKSDRKTRKKYDPDITLQGLEQQYLRLQTNFEKNKRYAQAGDFYIGAMEMRRKQLNQNSNKIRRWLRQNLLSLLALYRLASLYGERYTRSLIWMLCIILIFPTFFLLSGFEFPINNNALTNSYEYIEYDLSSKFDLPNFKDLKNSLVISFYSFTFQRKQPYRLTLESQIASIIENILSAILIALFLLAIRRRFRR